MEIEVIRKTLLSTKEELEARQERTHKHIYLKDEPVSPNFGDQVKQTENDQLVMTLEAEGKDELAKINRALQRIDDQIYSDCSACGNTSPRVIRRKVG